jgi:RNA polymerase sigma factor (sigma-70 family)
MLGSRFEAEDAVQETMVRAWRRLDGFESRSTLRTWLYSIATNVCLDMRRQPQRRATPMDVRLRLADGHGAVAGSDPADVAVSRDATRVALRTVLRHLPPRQRAVLILREGLGWRAREVAQLLGTTVASVNSALQRARARLDAVDEDGADHVEDWDQHRLLDSYMDALERLDIGSLVRLASVAVVEVPAVAELAASVSKSCVDSRGRGVEQLGHRRVVPTQPVPQDEHRPGHGRQPPQGDEQIEVLHAHWWWGSRVASVVLGGDVVHALS